MSVEYNGTTAVSSGTADLTVTVINGVSSANYDWYFGTGQTISLTITDGQAAGTQAIKVTSANKDHFNAYANTAAGRVKHYKMGESITLIGTNNWVPIGSYDNPFNGSFDGQNSLGYIISGLNIGSSQSYQGFSRI